MQVSHFSLLQFPLALLISLFLLFPSSTSATGIDVPELDDAYFTNAIMLPPTKTTGRPLVLVLFSGGSIATKGYVGLATKVQDQTNRPTWVTIADSKTVNMDDRIVGRYLERIRRAISNRTETEIQSSEIILSGHSKGGIVALAYSAKHEVGGTITLGSYLPKLRLVDLNMNSFSNPILVLGGTRDGYTPFEMLHQEWVEWSKRLPTDPEKRALGLTRKSIIMLPGINHSQFGSPELMPRDLPPEDSYENAQERIAVIMGAFLNGLQNSDMLARSSRVLAEAHRESAEFWAPYIRLKELEPDTCSWLNHKLTDLTSHHQSDYQTHGTRRFSEFARTPSAVLENDAGDPFFHISSWQESPRLDIPPVDRFPALRTYCRLLFSTSLPKNALLNRCADAQQLILEEADKVLGNNSNERDFGQWKVQIESPNLADSIAKVHFDRQIIVDEKVIALKQFGTVEKSDRVQELICPLLSLSRAARWILLDSLKDSL